MPRDQRIQLNFVIYKSFLLSIDNRNANHLFGFMTSFQTIFKKHVFLWTFMLIFSFNILTSQNMLTTLRYGATYNLHFQGHRTKVIMPFHHHILHIHCTMRIPMHQWQEHHSYVLSTLPRLLIRFPRLFKPPSIRFLALKNVIVAWLAVLKDIFPLPATRLNCNSLRDSRRSRGGGSLRASSSWSDLVARLQPGDKGQFIYTIITVFIWQ